MYFKFCNVQWSDCDPKLLSLQDHVTEVRSSTRPLVPTISPKSDVTITDCRSTGQRASDNSGEGLVKELHRATVTANFLINLLVFFNCPMYSAFYNLKMYDESDNLL